jgi:hypothetical protein
MNPGAVFYTALAQIMQVRLPLTVMPEIFGDMTGEKNVAGVSAIHHPLRSINPRASNIGLIVDISNPVDGPTVNAHSQLQLRMFL